jgi:Leucine-rich repeat (LRR) protein
MIKIRHILSLSSITAFLLLALVGAAFGQKSQRLSKANNTVDRNSHYLIKNQADADAFSRIYNISDLTSLEIKFADENMLNNLAMASGLKSLWLKNLGLEFVPDGIFELTELKLLSLQQNPIKILPKGICNCTNLSEIILWDTEIHRFPLCMEELPIRRVDLYGVQMNELDQDDLRALLPRAKLALEAPCDCKFDD